MSESLLTLLGVVLIGVGLWGLVSGKVVAGSRGFKSNYYSRKDSPLLFYSFVFIYISIGFFIFNRMP